MPRFYDYWKIPPFSMQIAALTDGQTLLLFAIEKLIVIETDQKYSMALNDLCW